MRKIPCDQNEEIGVIGSQGLHLGKVLEGLVCHSLVGKGVSEIIGGMAPLICTALVTLTGSLYSVAAFVIVIALISFTSSYLMTETLRTGLRSDEPARTG